MIDLPITLDPSTTLLIFTAWLLRRYVPPRGK